MNLVVDIQNIERNKRLKWCQELREIAIPLHQKINMNKVKSTRHPKDTPKMSPNWLEERKGEGVPKRPNEFPKGPPELIFIPPVEEQDGASSNLIAIEEPLSVEAVFRALHIIALETPMLAIVLDSP